MTNSFILKSAVEQWERKERSYCWGRSIAETNKLCKKRLKSSLCSNLSTVSQRRRNAPSFPSPSIPTLSAAGSILPVFEWGEIKRALQMKGRWESSINVWFQIYVFPEKGTAQPCYFQNWIIIFCVLILTFMY